MGAPRPHARFGTPASISLALGLLLLGGCDKGGEEEKKDDEAAAKTDEESKKADDEEAKKADDEEAKKADDEEAKKTADEEAKKAEEEAAAKKAEEEAAAKKAEEEAKSRPVALSDLAVKTMGGMFGGTGMLEVSAKATVNQVLGDSTYVHIKSLCKKDDLLIADVGYLNAHYSKPLEQYGVGEEAEVKGSIYTQGLKSALSPCQFELRVGGLGGGLSVPVGEACWDGSKVADGKCDPALAPVAMSGGGAPIEVHQLDVERGGGFGGSKGLNLEYLLKISEPQDNNVRITFKTACRVGGKSFADLGQANLSAGPFKYESGETIARSAGLYWSSSFELDDAPNDCDITTSLWRTKAGTFGEYEELRLQDSCFKDGKLTTGRCDPSTPPPPPPAPLVAESVVVDDVRLELAEPYGATGKFQLKIQADVTLQQPVTQNDGVTAKVSCKAGKENRVETAYLFGTELHYLQPGETTRMTANSFGSTPLDTKPKSCLVEFFGGPRFSPTGAEGVDLGKFCLKKDKVKKGAKC
ncbi:MAG: hypothetical protein H6712_12005 [Myxococcales bacterium]|nr:hypothetical protein [Myxococcales bacterium]MCB9714579.1 hypothetical protein [Myxococcales bacterium]